MKVLRWLLGALAAWSAPLAFAADSIGQATASSAGNVGVSGVWVWANICYAGMRAQNHPSVGWRMLSFIGGFPATFITWLVVDEGGERAYGIELPRKR
jgi:hypothetical protein